MKTIRVCNGRNCLSCGSESIMEKLSLFFHLKAGEKNDKVDLDYCRCLSFCSDAPSVSLDDKFITKTSTDTIISDLETGGKKREDISAYKIDWDDDFLSI